MDTTDLTSRILVVSSFYFPDRAGGQAKIAYDLAQAYVSLGHEVWFLCQCIDEKMPAYQEEAGIHILRYSVKRSRSLDFTLHNKHVSAAKEMLDRFFPGYPHIVHGHDLLPYVAAIEKFQGKSQLCYTIHSPAIEELNISWKNQGFAGTIKRLLGLPIIKHLEKKALESSDALEAKSKFIRTLIQKHYGSAIADQICLIPGWVDTKRFHPLSTNKITDARLQLEWPLDIPVLFTLRRLESRMGLDNYLFALKIVKNRGYEVFTVIGGTGSRKMHLLNLCNQLQLSDSVRFGGFVSDDTLPLAYGACDVSIVPTAKLEGFGIIVLEGLACGKPVLTTPVGALPEVVSTFESSWIARSSEPKALADLICDFLDNKLPQYNEACVLKKLEDYSFSKALTAYVKWLGI